MYLEKRASEAVEILDELLYEGYIDEKLASDVLAELDSALEAYYEYGLEKEAANVIDETMEFLTKHILQGGERAIQGGKGIMDHIKAPFKAVGGKVKNAFGKLVEKFKRKSNMNLSINPHFHYHNHPKGLGSHLGEMAKAHPLAAGGLIASFPGAYVAGKYLENRGK